MSTERRIEARSPTADIASLRERVEGAAIWLPIETAPKDGTWFLAYRPESDTGCWSRVVVVQWNAECDDFIWPDGIHDIYTGPDLSLEDDDGFLPDVYESGGSFTHWLPLPAPPVEGAST